jgi:hypothetical protein
VPRQNPAIVRFGYFGAASKGGIDLFHRLAVTLPPSSFGSAFLMIGFMSSEADALRYAGDITGVSSQPLSSEEYDSRASSITYAVWAANPENYRLAASASFIDALSYLKPGIYLRSAYVEYYFNRLGDIGYLCDSYEEMEDIARSILMEFPFERYQRQCENIVRGRSIFEPSTIAPQLRAIVTACENRVPQ